MDCTMNEDKLLELTQQLQGAYTQREKAMIFRLIVEHIGEMSISGEYSIGKRFIIDNNKEDEEF